SSRAVRRWRNSPARTAPRGARSREGLALEATGRYRSGWRSAAKPERTAGRPSGGGRTAPDRGGGGVGKKETVTAARGGSGRGDGGSRRRSPALWWGRTARAGGHFPPPPRSSPDLACTAASGHTAKRKREYVI